MVNVKIIDILSVKEKKEFIHACLSVEFLGKKKKIREVFDRDTWNSIESRKEYIIELADRKVV